MSRVSPRTLNFECRLRGHSSTSFVWRSTHTGPITRLPQMVELSLLFRDSATDATCMCSESSRHATVQRRAFALWSCAGTHVWFADSRSHRFQNCRRTMQASALSELEIEMMWPFHALSQQPPALRREP